ncbi:unnamed protein product, partial [Trichogramma brassicae]
AHSGTRGVRLAHERSECDRRDAGARMCDLYHRKNSHYNQYTTTYKRHSYYQCNQQAACNVTADVSHATPKRHAVTPASKQHDENNNEVGDQDGFVLVDRRRHRQRKQTAATPGAVHARQQPKPRPVQRRARHRPDVIVIKAKDASKYADILRSLKSDPTLQQKVGSSVNNIRRSAAGALMLQLKKGVENASDLGEELGKVLGTAATASALLHTSTIEIKDLDECATKEEVTAALDALPGVPVSKRDPVKSLRKAYAGTQVAVVALPDDLAATALKLGHVRIGWVNCRIRAREEAARCYRCWSPGHVAARCKGPDRTELSYRCGQKGHQAKDCKGQPSSTSITARLPRTCFATPSASCASTWPSCVSNTRTLLHPTHGSPMPTAKQLSGCMEEFRCRSAQREYIPTSRGPESAEFSFSASTLHQDSLRGNFPPSLPTSPRRPAAEGPLLLRGTSTHGRRCGDVGRLDTGDLLNTGDVPTFNGRQGSSIVDLTDHQAIVFEIEDDGASSRPSTRRSYRWNARTLDVDGFSAVVSSASVAPGTAEDMASSLMSVITGACDASMSKANPRRRREPVYWWTAEIADLRRSCLRARRLFQRSRGRHDEETHSANYASARRLLCVAIKTSKRRCWRQLCNEVNNDVWGKPYKIAMSRLGCPQAKQPSSPLLVRSAVAALFPRVPSGPALQLPRRAEELYRPSPWRNSKELSRGSRSAPRPARMAYPTQRSRSLLPHDPTSSCGCIRCVWRPAFSRLAGSARDSSCSQSQANLPTSRPRIVRC